MNLHPIFACISRNSLLKTGAISLSESNGIRTHNHLAHKRTLNHYVWWILAKLTSLAKWLSVGLRTKWFWVRLPLLSLTSWTLRVTSSTLRVTSLNPRITSWNLSASNSNPRVVSSNPWVKSLNPLQESLNQWKFK